MRNNTLQKYLWGICFFFITGTPLFGQVSTNDILERIRISNYSPSDDLVAQNLASINPNGSWSDINYDDYEALGSWEPNNKHNGRVLQFAQAYTMSPTYIGNSSLYTAIVNAMTFYYNYNPTTINGWHQNIAAPQKITLILVYMKAGATAFPNTLETNILNRLDALWDPSRYDPGANRIDIASWHLLQALLRDNTSQISYAATWIFNSLVFSTDEGLQHDGSYQSHGPQLHDYSYGTVFFSVLNKYIKYLEGSSYGMSASNLAVYSYLLTEGVYPEARRGGYRSFSPMGRAISRDNAVREGSDIFSDAIIADPANAAIYQAIVDRINGTIDPGFGIVPKNSVFYRSGFATQNTPKYTFTVRSTSTRLINQESLGDENIKGLYLADGATNILVKGDEYFNIFPVWDWTKIPGVTAPYKTSLDPGYLSYGTSTFTGGATNGSYGAYCYSMNNYSTQVKKSWFCFDNEIVCLGAGLSSSDANAISTTVNQTNLDGPVIISQSGSTSTLASESSNTYNNSVDWVLHDTIGYFFPKSGNLKISNVTQNGSWGAINPRHYGADPVSANVFKLWFDHGVQPNNNSYAYIVAPSISNTAQMQSYNLSNINIIANTSQIQAVKNNALDMIQVVFYQADSLAINGITLKVDKPCSMVLSNVSTANIGVSISDPSESNSDVSVYWESPLITGLRELKCEIPVGDADLGSTVQYVINTDTPLKAPKSTNIIALEDAYVRGGTYASVNYGTVAKMDIKLDANSDEYAREVYFKFNLSDITTGIGTYKFKINVTGIWPATWNVNMVDKDSWSEGNITWANRPAKGALINTLNVTGAGVYELDITSQVDAELLGDKTISLCISSVTNNAFDQILSKENADSSVHPQISFTITSLGLPTLLTDDTNMITVYPIPVVADKFNVDLSIWQGDKVTIEVYSLSGKKVFSEVIKSTGIKEVSVKKMLKGLYLLRLTNGKDSITKKIIVN